MAARRVSTKAGQGTSGGGGQPVSADKVQATEGNMGDAVLESRIAARAYALFLARGAQHGDDLADWFQAEREVLAEERPAPDPAGP